jgi:hypothetical protein
MTTAVGVERVENGYIIRTSAESYMPRILVAATFDDVVRILRKELSDDRKSTEGDL